MSEISSVGSAAEVRAEELKTSLRRHRLCFVQFGAAFDVIRKEFLAATSGVVCTAHDLASGGVDTSESTLIIVDELEQFAATGSYAGETLGGLRTKVDAALDCGTDVCLVSRAPRCAYHPVPGSSLLEDSALFILRLLESGECGEHVKSNTAWRLPSVGLAEESPSLSEALGASLLELGPAVLAALDHALYEVGPFKDFVVYLDDREVEAIRGAGLARRDTKSGAVSFVLPQRLAEFRLALSDILASIVDPPAGIADVSSGLWQIERTIRYKLRTYALATFGDKWRKQILHGDLGMKVLERARADVAVTARSVAELRDPFEWLSLGELLQIISHSTVGGLGHDAVLWTKFANDIVPIRNRLSHMRLIRKGDRETVLMWVSHIRRIL